MFSLSADLGFLEVSVDSYMPAQMSHSFLFINRLALHFGCVQKSLTLKGRNICIRNESEPPHQWKLCLIHPETTHRGRWCRSAEGLTLATYSSDFVGPLQVHQSEPASSCERVGLLPPPHRSVTHVCQNLTGIKKERIKDWKTEKTSSFKRHAFE